MTQMNAVSRVRGVSAFLVRLLAYYVLVTVLMVALVQVFPGFQQMLSLDLQQAAPAARLGEQTLLPPRALSSQLGPLANTAILGALAMLGGLIFAIPVAWTYTETKADEGYEKSVVQMIVMLPLAVGGVVLLVRGELALAFALAGIVAAVRFRTTFKDVKDAVFAFVAIGLGLASGMQAWLLALVMSLVFCMVVIGLWQFEIGEVGVASVVPTGPQMLSQALTPGDPERPIVVGDPLLTAPLANDEMDRIAAVSSRLEQHVRADALREKQKFKHLLLVHAGDVEEAEDRVEDVIDDYAKRWQLVETLPGRDGTQVLEYLIRFKKSAAVGDLLDRLQGDDAIRALELKSMKGLRKLVT